MSSNGTDAETESKSSDDSFLALVILVSTVVAVLLIGLYLWRTKKLMDNSWKTNAFTAPPERDNYIKAREKLDPSVPSELEELKKLLMRRAMQNIPLLLNLQKEGNSIERLYKRGMLTDDMHFKVKELQSFVDKEFHDVQVEADDLVAGWGSSIWPQAMQFYQVRYHFI
jgi:hypothetical protein